MIVLAVCLFHVTERAVANLLAFLMTFLMMLVIGIATG